jgi:hypothetical protein
MKKGISNRDDSKKVWHMFDKPTDFYEQKRTFVLTESVIRDIV